MPGFQLCGIRVVVEDACLMDRVCLRPGAGCSCWQRTLLCGGEVSFGFLPPGAYALTLCRNSRSLRLWLELPPGGNVVLRCALGEGRCRWRQDLFRYFFNAL